MILLPHSTNVKNNPEKLMGKFFSLKEKRIIMRENIRNEDVYV